MVKHATKKLGIARDHVALLNQQIVELGATPRTLEITSHARTLMTMTVSLGFREAATVTNVCLDDLPAHGCEHKLECVALTAHLCAARDENVKLEEYRHHYDSYKTAKESYEAMERAFHTDDLSYNNIQATKVHDIDSPDFDFSDIIYKAKNDKPAVVSEEEVKQFVNVKEDADGVEMAGDLASSEEKQAQVTNLKKDNKCVADAMDDEQGSKQATEASEKHTAQDNGSEKKDRKRVKVQESTGKQFMLKVFRLEKGADNFELANSQHVSFHQATTLKKLCDVSRSDIASMTESGSQVIDTIIQFEAPDDPGSFKSIDRKNYVRWTQAAQGLEEDTVTCRYFAFPVELKVKARDIIQGMMLSA